MSQSTTNRINSVRREIFAGTYETYEKLCIAGDRLLDEMKRRAQHEELDDDVEERGAAMDVTERDDRFPML